MNPWIVDPWQGQALERGEVGGKAAGLESLRRAGARLPRFLALKAQAFDALAGKPLPADFLAELNAALAKAGLQGKPLALRSSALAEDGSQASYAGIFESVLAVGEAGLEAALAQVWGSAKSERALAYARKFDPGAAQARMGVVIQELLDPHVSGVAFTADPVSGERGTVVISAVYGLGEALVSGELDGDTWRVGREARLELRPKPQALRRAPEGGTRWEPLDPAKAAAPCLSEAQARELAAAFKKIEAAFGLPQDLEWALDDQGVLWLLQARPITQLAPRPRVWDNANIVESYGGLTLPLTFSFACAVYEQAYLVFSRFAGVPERVLKAHPEIFSERLGLIRGRVYYDLINWYRNLAMLPFYRFNQKAMEEMMGVAEALPQDLEPGSQFSEAWRAFRVGLRLAAAALRAQANERAFHALVDAVLLPLEERPCAGLPAPELAARFQRLWDELLLNWRTPIVHDVFAMASLGLMQALLRRWQPGLEPGVTADLLRAQGGMASAEPARLTQALAARWRSDPALSRLFDAEPDNAKLWSLLEKEAPGFHAEIRAYLKRWGLRCEGELKLETIPLEQDPAAFVAILRAQQGTWQSGEQAAADQAARRMAEAKALAGLGLAQRLLLRFSVRWARARMLSRENLRFERTRAFGEVRRIFLALGSRLYEAGLIEEQRDVFCLELGEVLAWARGGPGGGFKAKAAAAKADYAAWAAQPAPPSRFQGEPPAEEQPLADPGAELKGLGACAGVVRGRARLVRDPSSAGDLSGCILVAERTDPGWTLIFPQAAGLAVERGSLLSHSAVVARELGLPCVVGIGGLMRGLREGELLELDGARGILRRLERA